MWVSINQGFGSQFMSYCFDVVLTLDSCFAQFVPVCQLPENLPVASQSLKKEAENEAFSATTITKGPHHQATTGILLPHFLTVYTVYSWFHVREVLPSFPLHFWTFISRVWFLTLGFFTGRYSLIIALVLISDGWFLSTLSLLCRLRLCSEFYAQFAPTTTSYLKRKERNRFEWQLLFKETWLPRLCLLWACGIKVIIDQHADTHMPTQLNAWGSYLDESFTNSTGWLPPCVWVLWIL